MKKFLQMIAAVFMAVLAFLPTFVSAKAEAYSSAYEFDLSKDFDSSDYPEDPHDYSVNLLRISETTDKTLLLYVYRPAVASDVGIDCTLRRVSFSTVLENPDFKNYKVTRLDQNGALEKYKVNGFTVGNETTRYYSFSSFYRDFNPNIDTMYEGIESFGTVEMRPYAIGQRWRAVTKDGVTTYDSEREEVVTIMNKYVGHIEYKSGAFSFGSRCNAHFVAFSTDRNIETLLEVKVTYVSQLYAGHVGAAKPSGTAKIEYKTLNIEDKGSATVYNFFVPRKYKWERIQSTSKFLSDKNVKDLHLTEEAQEGIKNTDWVLHFTETGYAVIGLGMNEIPEELYTVISYVQILQLTFIENGETYTLGAVDMPMTPDEKPDGSVSTEDDWEAWFKDTWNSITKGVKIIIGVAVLGVVLAIFAPILPWIIKGAFKVLWWIIAFPFNLIALIFKKDKKSGQKK